MIELYTFFDFRYKNEPLTRIEHYIDKSYLVTLVLG